MYHPTARLLAILELLQTHRRLSGRELVERLEVAPRTLRRYVTMLQDMGIPIEAERGRHGGYTLRPGYKLPPLMFGDEEALALSLGLLTVRRLGLVELAPAVEAAAAKLERVLPGKVQERVRAVQATISMSLPRPLGTSSGVVLGTLSSAAQQRRRVAMRYRSWQGKPSERAVDPYGLVYHNGRWFVVGYCHLRCELRVFRLDRVEDAGLCDETFERPDDFDSTAFVLHSLATSPGIWRVEVLLKTSLEYAQQHVPPALATLEPATDGVVLRCNVQQLGWLAHFLAGLECELVVRRPPELRGALRELAAHARRLAEA